jgi:conflict system pore-forming effector with SLATT domain
MDLIDHWVVGFSGKRKLNNPEGVRAVLRDVLQSLRRLTDGQLVAISSVAIGADSLFVDEAMNLGIPWICVLPFPQNAFFNDRDFPAPQEKEAARQKLREAADCEVVRIPRSPDELNDSTWRRAAFAEAGFRCVDEADIVIIVLHDAADPGKPGGTGDVVTYARAGKRPLVVIDPDTQQVRRENWPTRLHDPFTERLRRLPSGSLTAGERDRLPTPAAIKVAEWRSGFARAARHHVPGIRWGTSAVVILHALATIITASVFLLLHPVNFDSPNFGRLQSVGGSLIAWGLEVSAFIFVLIGFCFLVWLLWKRPQINAANYRLAAEVGRSIIATWLIPGAASEIIRGLPHGFTHLARTLLLHQRLDPDRPRKGTDEIAGEGDVEKLAAAYVDQRINPQIKYYSEKYRVSARRARALEIGSIIFSSVAVVSAGFLAFGHAVESQRALLGFAKLAAATAAPVVVSMLVIHEVKRREARYHEMRRMLEQYVERINQVRSLSALEDLVTDVERMLLSECYEWWVLAKANVAA